MSVSFNSELTSANLNNAFASKIEDNNLSGQLTLSDPDSGASINNVQQLVNNINDDFASLTGANSIQGNQTITGQVTLNKTGSGNQVTDLQQTINTIQGNIATLQSSGGGGSGSNNVYTFTDQTALNAYTPSKGDIIILNNFTFDFTSTGSNKNLSGNIVLVNINLLNGDPHDCKFKDIENSNIYILGTLSLDRVFFGTLLNTSVKFYNSGSNKMTAIFGHNAAGEEVNCSEIVGNALTVIVQTNDVDMDSSKIVADHLYIQAPLTLTRCDIKVEEFLNRTTSANDVQILKDTELRCDTWFTTRIVTATDCYINVRDYTRATSTSGLTLPLKNILINGDDSAFNMNFGQGTPAQSNYASSIPPIKSFEFTRNMLKANGFFYVTTNTYNDVNFEEGGNYILIHEHANQGDINYASSPARKVFSNCNIVSLKGSNSSSTSGEQIHGTVDDVYKNCTLSFFGQEHYILAEHMTDCNINVIGEADFNTEIGSNVGQGNLTPFTRQIDFLNCNFKLQGATYFGNPKFRNCSIIGGAIDIVVDAFNSANDSRYSSTEPGPVGFNNCILNVYDIEVYLHNSRQFQIDDTNIQSRYFTIHNAFDRMILFERCKVFIEDFAGSNQLVQVDRSYIQVARSDSNGPRFEYDTTVIADSVNNNDYIEVLPNNTANTFSNNTQTIEKKASIYNTNATSTDFWYNSAVIGGTNMVVSPFYSEAGGWDTGNNLFGNSKSNSSDFTTSTDTSVNADNYIQTNFTGTVKITVAYQRAVIMVNSNSSLSNPSVEARVQKKNGSSANFVDFGTAINNDLLSNTTGSISFNNGSNFVSKRKYEFEGKTYTFYQTCVPNDRFSLHNSANAVTTTGAFRGASLTIERV